jgi:hypothetical protein
MSNSYIGARFLTVVLLAALFSEPAVGQNKMNPFFSAVNYPMEKQSLMIMVLPDYQSAKFGNDYLTWMLMTEYGITSRWTAGVMVEGQKIEGLPATFGGLRLSTYYHVFKDSRWVNLTLYGEFEDLNGASLYKMEVAGFGPEDLTTPLDQARQSQVLTVEQRLILYHDWDRLNATFNFIRETPLQSPFGSDYGYALGVFYQPFMMVGPMPEMPDMTPPSLLSLNRLGYGVEMIGALGDDHRFGKQWNAMQQYIGPVLMYSNSSALSVRIEPAFGLTGVSDPFMLRVGIAFMPGMSNHRSME